MDLTLEKLQPFLPPLTTAQTTRVEAWIPVLELLLNERYGDRITSEPSDDDPPVPANEPVFVSAAADAIVRRLARPNGMIDQQNVGPAGVRYNVRANLAVWFLPEEISGLDAFLDGVAAGARTYRTPAPDGIRFGNRMRPVFDQVAESDGVFVEEA